MQWDCESSDEFSVLISGYNGRYKDIEAYVRKDGCVELDLGHCSGADKAHIHICDFDRLITMLQTVKQKAIEHFGGEWPQ